MKSKIIADMRIGDPDLSEKEAGRRFESVVDSIRAVIDQDGTARVPGLGTFTKKTLPARQGRHPRTGEVMDLASKDVIRFKQTSSSK